MAEPTFNKITEYIFAPFNSFLFLNVDRLHFIGISNIREQIIQELNKEPLVLPDCNCQIEWCTEECEDFKKSKGVFTPPGQINSFIMARVVGETLEETDVPIKEAICNQFPEHSLAFQNVRFYFHEFGVSICSASIEITAEKQLSILQLDDISERLNEIYRDYFQIISFQLTQKYLAAIQALDIPYYQFEFFPNIEEVDRGKHFIPWTHRLYHIEDKTLFELENPGKPFQFLLTPSRQMGVEDLSIYDNRYIYFGWGHSIILTTGETSGYSQTNRPPYDYVRLIEIAQANWQCLDVLADLIDITIASFQEHYAVMGMKKIKQAITEIRDFNIAIDRVLSYFQGVKITFDTEKRILLDELHDRWLTNEMFMKLQERMTLIQEVLADLYNRQKEQREESLNTIVLIFTIFSVIEIIALIFDFFAVPLPSIIKFLVIVGGTLLTGLGIIIYIRYSGRE
ncbi:MAG: hypothetical protein GF308_07850 [Candidatus Heimdallarchaeota archaeon]|nr:hypothetical protein [Candidatus Heimdallarchaeota archaeon]